MNINELRLFNEIDTPVGYKKVMGLSVVNDNEILIMTGNVSGYYVPDLCNGIPITSEILELFGFENGEIRPSYKLHMAVRPYQTATQGVFPGEWQVVLLDAVPHPLGQTIKYLHQLQNLYFALTNEELNVKL